MKITIPLLLICLLLSACSAPDDAHRILDEQGYTNIQIGGYVFMMCSVDDLFSTYFTATNAIGRQVTGAVCSGLAKGSTIRFK
jgi:hypothetical protein